MMQLIMCMRGTAPYTLKKVTKVHKSIDTILEGQVFVFLDPPHFLH